MDDPGPVAVLQRVEHTGGDPQGVVDLYRRGLLQQLLDGATAHLLHDDVRLRSRSAVGVQRHVLTGVVHRDDGGVVEGGRRLRLALEARLERGVASQVGTQQLDGHGAAEPGVPGGPDLGHATAPDLLDERVALADQPGAARRLVSHRPSFAVVPSVERSTWNVTTGGAAPVTAPGSSASSR